MASIPEARTAFNLKVLRRHDPSIVTIFETASFVVLYNYNDGEWTKTGVEGPLFLFRRRLPPYNGFFLMNRNGVENFSADVTPDDDLEITPEFIIYRPEQNDEVYGIWVFEPSQRMAVGDKLLRLQQMGEAPKEEEIELATSLSSAVQEGGSDGKVTPADVTRKASKGKANGKPKRGGNAQKQAEKQEAAVKEVTVQAASAEADSGTQISLDDLFGTATTPAQATEAASSSEKPSEPPASDGNGGSSLLDSLFQSAVSINANPTSNSNATETSKAPAESTDPTHAQNLLALLGAGTTTSNTPASASQAAQQTNGSQAPRPEPSVEKKDAPKMADLIEQGITDRIGLGDDGKPLSRREFVTELLSMVHTNPDFVTELYDSYVSRVS